MKIKGTACILCLVAVFGLLASGTVLGQDKLKMKDYNIQLADAQGKETGNKAKIAAVQTDIDALKKQIGDTQTQIDATWSGTYAALGTDKAGVDAYRNGLTAINGDIDGMSAMSPEDLFRNQDKIEAIEKKIADAKASKISMLSEMEGKIADLDAKMAALKAKVPDNIYDKYTVIKGDYLWKIAKKPDIYNNAFQWIRIYCVNKDQIKNPDLIFPAQNFKIARGVSKNEYLVAKGDYLKKIAGMAKVCGDPAKWVKLYEANKDIIQDKNIIYPYQVLTIPK
jgi:nucleoid-associated protein YgaU